MSTVSTLRLSHYIIFFFEKYGKKQIYARWHYIKGTKRQDSMFDVIHKGAENYDCLQGFSSLKIAICITLSLLLVMILSTTSLRKWNLRERNSRSEYLLKGMGEVLFMERVLYWGLEPKLQIQNSRITIYSFSIIWNFLWPWLRCTSWKWCHKRHLASFGASHEGDNNCNWLVCGNVNDKWCCYNLWVFVI